MIGKQPLARFRAGSASAAIWENVIERFGQQRKILNASIERRFKDDAGEWKSSKSFGRNDIPLAIWCLHQCFDEIIRRENDRSDDQDVQSTAVRQGLK